MVSFLESKGRMKLIISVFIFLLEQVWDEDLAEAAQDFSLLCELRSNLERASQVPGFETVGENWTGVGTQGLPNFTTVLSIAWFNQRVLYNFTENSCSTQDACIFYTQVHKSGQEP